LVTLNCTNINIERSPSSYGNSASNGVQTTIMTSTSSNTDGTFAQDFPVRLGTSSGGNGTTNNPMIECKSA
jgi:hypothetical protein